MADVLEFEKQFYFFFYILHFSYVYTCYVSMSENHCQTNDMHWCISALLEFLQASADI